MKSIEFVPINGKWVIGNLNDKLIAASFDKFINMKREHETSREPRVKRDLSHHNYQFPKRIC